MKDDIELEILSRDLYLDGDSITLDVKVTNNTDSSFLIFAFSTLHEGILKESFFTSSSNIASGTAVFIIDKNGDYLEEQELAHEFPRWRKRPLVT